jgi:hypothetical protein
VLARYLRKFLSQDRQTGETQCNGGLVGLPLTPRCLTEST